MAAPTPPWPTARRPTGSALGRSPHDVRYPSPITPGAAGVHVDHRPSWWTWSTGCQRRARCTVRCSVAEYESRKPSASLRTGHLCCCGGFRSASRHLAARVGERLVDDLLVTGTHIYRLGGDPVAVMARIRTGRRGRPRGCSSAGARVAGFGVGGGGGE